MIAYRTVDPWGRIYEVTDLFDQFGHPTRDPILAESCIIHIDDRLVPTDTDGVPIYTVH